MKFLHLSDLHLGKSLGEFDLIRDQRYFLERVLELIREKGVDTVLIAGDVYDKSIPSEAAVNLLDWFINELAEMKIHTFMISGNHDSDDRLNFGSALFEARGIHICAKFDGTLYKRVVTDDHGPVNVWLLPFVKASQVRHYYPDEAINNYEDAVRTIIDHAGIDPGERNVILSHQFVAGHGGNPKLGGSEGMGTQNVGTIEVIGASCYDPFDYAALGHIHSPQQVGRPEVRYAGSPLKYSLSEVNNAKSLPVVALEEKGNIDIELVPVKPLRDLRHIKGPLKKLLENVENKDDFIYATLTDEDIVNDVMGIVQQSYPNTVKIDYDNAHTREINDPDVEGISANQSFDDLVRQFYLAMYGTEISEEEMQIMLDAAKEAGVIHEAD
ncbi:MAG: exonuclease SbcCD subunit D [Lachnospiraceae bacterium]|nr:exonuclease SbcCD subunit D [Lachnospiraceae bacterium]